MARQGPGRYPFGSCYHREMSRWMPVRVEFGSHMAAPFVSQRLGLSISLLSKIDKSETNNTEHQVFPLFH